LTLRRDSERVTDETAGGDVVDRRVTEEETTTQRIPTRHRVADDRPTVDERPTVQEPPAAEDTVTAAPERPRWAHVSAMATLSLIIGVVAVAATLTGLLAAEGIVLGVIGGAVAAGGLVGASRRGVTGHSVALLGLVASLAAILLGVLAIGGELSWLDSDTDEVGRLHTWLLSQLPWLKHF
jgi:hypothetical protein